MARRSPGPPYRTAWIARETGVHPNTVRLYEAWGLLPPIPRTPAGYRKFSAAHLAQMRLARIALPGPFPGGGAPVYRLVREAALGDHRAARRSALAYAAQVEAERARAVAACRRLMAWARGRTGAAAPAPARPLRRRAACRALGVTVDALRAWERNGLVPVTKDPNGFCRYEPATLHRVEVVRALRTAGYSTLSILRMFAEHRRGNLAGMRRALDVPPRGADLVYVSDRWMATLREHRRRARRILQQLDAMAAAARRAA